jgi:hypothetical protein
MHKGESQAQKNTHPDLLSKHTFPLDNRVEPLLDWKQSNNKQPSKQEQTTSNPLHYQRRQLANNFITLIKIQLENSKARQMLVSGKTPCARVLKYVLKRALGY